MLSPFALGVWVAALVLAGSCLVHCGRGARASQLVVGRISQRELTNERQPFGGWVGGVQHTLRLAGMDISNRLIFAVCLGSFIAVSSGSLMMIGVFGIPIAAVAVALAVGLLFRAAQARSDMLLLTALPDGLDAISRSVRSGASITNAIAEAVEVVAPRLGTELAIVHRQLTRGLPLAEAMDGWVKRQPHGDVRLTAAALTFVSEAGGVRSRAIEGLADSLRDRRALRREVAALASQARMSAIVLAVLPVGFVALSLVSDGAGATFLFAESLGRLCLIGGVVLEVVGMLWMRRITGRFA